MNRLAAAIAAEGFAFAHGAEMRTLFGPMADWPAYAASWNDLGLDTYMADGGRYRKRRHAAFGAHDAVSTIRCGAPMRSSAIWVAAEPEPCLPYRVYTLPSGQS